MVLGTWAQERIEMDYVRNPKGMPNDSHRIYLKLRTPVYPRIISACWCYCQGGRSRGWRRCVNKHQRPTSGVVRFEFMGNRKNQLGLIHLAGPTATMVPWSIGLSQKKPLSILRAKAWRNSTSRRNRLGPRTYLWTTTCSDHVIRW